LAKRRTEYGFQVADFVFFLDDSVRKARQRKCVDVESRALVTRPNGLEGEHGPKAFVARHAVVRGATFPADPQMPHCYG